MTPHSYIETVSLWFREETLSANLKPFDALNSKFHFPQLIVEVNLRLWGHAASLSFIKRKKNISDHQSSLTEGQEI